MQYYIINYTLDAKVRGCNDTIKEYKYHGSIRNPNFIGMIHFQKINFKPIPVNPVLSTKAIKTDLIENGGQLAGKLLVSTKLKNILQKNDFGVQYFPNSIIHNQIEDFEHWIINPYENKNNCIDFEKSSIFYRKYNPEKIEDFQVLTLSKIEFKNLMGEKNMFDEIYICNFLLTTQCVSVDFFVLQKTISGLSYIVSETLKKEIEDAGCTGIEFQPIELSYNEWTASGGEREKVYGKS